MKQNPVRREFFHYLIPAVASLVSLSLYILADTFFISLGVGSLGLTALNIAIPAYSLLNAIGLMIGIGSGVLYAWHRSRGETEQANSCFQTALWMALAVGVLFTLVGVFGAEKTAALLRASEQSLAPATAYIRVMLSFSVFFLLNNLFMALIRNDGNPRLSMTAMIVNSMSNVVLDALFILGFGWGMEGAALATGLSPVLGLAIMSLHKLRDRNGFYLKRRLPDLRMAGAILRAGVASFITETGSGVVILLFNAVLMQLGGDIAVAAYGIVANVALVIGYIFMGIGQGMQPVISRMSGEGEMEKGKQVLKIALRLAVLTGIVCFAAGLLFPHRITELFNSEQNVQLARITVPAIQIHFSAFVFMAINYCCISWFQSTLQSRWASVLSLLRGIVLIIPATMLLSMKFGITGVWMVTPVCELITTLVCVTVLALRKKKNPQKRVLTGRSQII